MAFLTFLRLLVSSLVTVATCRAFATLRSSVVGTLPPYHLLKSALQEGIVKMNNSRNSAPALASSTTDNSAAALAASSTTDDSAASLAASSTTDSPSIACQAVEGLEIVSPRYDAFLIGFGACPSGSDQWGVMHNGKTPYSGAVECIDRLAAAGKKIVLLSNSSKRKSAALNNLQRMGFATGSILDVVTSGQIAWDGLQQKVAEPFKSLGKKCLVFGNGDDDAEYVSSCGCILAEAADADFILARGSFVVLGSNGVRRYAPTIMTGEGKLETEESMRLMIERGAKMLVTNPDFLRPGTNDPMPGLIGQAYANMGGTVHYVGKPHPAVYEACLQALRGDTVLEAGEEQSVAAGPPHLTVAAVGDSLPHDILGALRTGIGSVFVAGGVHFEELGMKQRQGEVPSDEAYSTAFARHLEGAGMPTYAMPVFRW